MGAGASSGNSKRAAPSSIQAIDPVGVEVGPILGCGTFTVHSGTWWRGEMWTGTLRRIAVAIKRYEAPGLKAEEVLQQVHGMLDRQLQASNENLLQIHGICKEHADLQGAVLLVTEFMPLGSLHRNLFPEQGAPQRVLWVHRMITCKPFVLMTVFGGVAKGLRYLHECQPLLLHLNLKTANVLLEDSPNSEEGPVHLRARICDVDTDSRFCDFRAEAATLPAKGTFGPPGILSPERLRRDPDAAAPPADIYSLGILIIESINIAVPFEGMQHSEILDNLCTRENLPQLDRTRPTYSTGYDVMVEGCLAFSPAERWTAEAVSKRITTMLEAVLHESRTGVTVHRGPGWKWGDQDGGSGSLGTTVEGSKRPGWVRVRWGDGTEKTYRCGAEGEYDLAPHVSHQPYAL